jgi:hypothetical protein
MEHQERYRTTKLMEAIAAITKSNTTKDQADEKEETDEDEPTTSARPQDDALAVGEGYHSVSWIWLAGLQLEDIHNPQLTDGKLGFYVYCTRC